MKISIIGAGYVGLVTGTCLADFNHEVTCIDIDTEKINTLINGKIPIFEPGLQELINKNIQENRLNFTTEIGDAICNSNVIFITVGTPSDNNGNVDISYLESAVKNISKYLIKYTVIVTKSTVPPGTAAKLMKLLKSLGIDRKMYDVVSNPEFLREGSAINDFMVPDRIVIGSDSPKATQIMKDVYRPLFLREIPIIETNHSTAELIKYATNSFLAAKISFINEIAKLCDAMDADIYTVSKAMGLDGRISPKFLHAGPGFGGSCFPKDVLGLFHIARDYNIDVNLIQGILETNTKQKLLMVDKFISLMGGDINGKKIAILGLAFKPNTDDIREAPSLVIIKELLNSGAIVCGYDPVAVHVIKKVFPDVEFTDNIEKCLHNASGAILVTEWNELRSLQPKNVKNLMNGNVFFDCRNIYKPDIWINAGFNFGNVGRM